MSPFFDELEEQLRSAAHQRHRRPWWRRPRNLGLAAVAAVGIATPAVARVTGVWDPGLPPQPRAHTATVSSSGSVTCRQVPPPSRADAAVDPRLRRLLGVLRTPQTPADRFPEPSRFRYGDQTLLPSTVRKLGSVGETRYYVGFLLTRQERAGCPTLHTPVHAILCLLTDNGSGGCGGTPNNLLQHGLDVSSLNRSGRSQVVALVPDDVTAITVRYRSSTRTFPARRNFVGYEIAADPSQSPDAIVWHLHDRTTRTLRPPP
jgi:hypothetical protein